MSDRHVLDIAVDHSISISEAFRVKAATDLVRAEKDRRRAPGARGQTDENESED